MKSIGTKFALQIAVVLVIVMASFGGIELRQREREFANLLRARQARISKQIALLSSEFLFYMNLEPLQYLARSYLDDPELLSLKISEKELTHVYLGKIPGSAELRDVQQSGQQPPTYTDAAAFHEPIIYNGKEIGAIDVTFSRASLRQQFQQTLYTLIVNLASIVAVEILMVLLLANRNITRPLLRVIQTTQQISAGHLDAEAPQRAAQDEIGLLTQAIQGMAGQLKRVIQHVRAVSNQVAASSQEMQADFSADVRQSEYAGVNGARSIQFHARNGRDNQPECGECQIRRADCAGRRADCGKNGTGRRGNCRQDERNHQKNFRD